MAAAECSKWPCRECPDGAPCSAPLTSPTSRHHPCQHLSPCILRLCTQFLKIQPQEISPCETYQTDPHETLPPNCQSPELPTALPPGHRLCRGQQESHALLPSSCSYDVPVTLPSLERFVFRKDTHRSLQRDDGCKGTPV